MGHGGPGAAPPVSRGTRIAAIAAFGLLVAGLVLSQLAPSGSRAERPVGPTADDPSPRGLLGLSLLLEGSDHPVERLAEAPSAVGLDDAATTFLVEPGELTATDAEALGGLARGGGRVVIAGDPGDEALERIMGTPVDISDSTGGASAAPLVPAPETSGIATIGGAGPGEIADPAATLPLLGDGGLVAASVADVGDGRVVVLADASTLQNQFLVESDNARLALNLAGPAGRPVQLVESVLVPPSSGLAALPSDWAWAFAGLVLAALALVAARARRLGPPELAARALQPPRRAYVDALAAALARSGDPAAAARPLRAAARERLARRAGLAHDFDDDALGRAAEAAGLAPEEVRALRDIDGGEDAMLAAGAALAKLR